MASEVEVVVASVGSSTPDELRQLIDVLRRKSPAGLAVLLASAVDGKVNLAAGLTPDLIALGLTEVSVAERLVRGAHGPGRSVRSGDFELPESMA